MSKYKIYIQNYNLIFKKLRYNNSFYEKIINKSVNSSLLQKIIQEHKLNHNIHAINANNYWVILICIISIFIFVIILIYFIFLHNKKNFDQLQNVELGNMNSVLNKND